MQGVQTPPPRAKRGVLRALLLIGMGLMIPCYLFTVGNVALSPWPLYERNRLALAILTPLCLALLLLLRRAAKAACFERHERAVLLGFAAFYFAAQMISAFALRFTPMTDLEQCVSAARRLLDANQPGLSERSLIYLGRNPHNMGVIYLFCAIFRAADLLGADQLLCAALVCSLLFTAGLLCAARLCRRLGGAQAQARALLLFATCLPFLYCTSELYTDVFSLAFSPMILLAYFKARDAESLRARAGYALLFALSAFFGAQLRFTTVIAAIACLIAALFEKRVKLTAILAVPLALCFALGGTAIQAENEKHLGAENIRNNKLPVLHFVLMGLPVQSDEGYGQYGDGGWLIFTTSFDSPQARDAALRQKFIDRAYTLAHHPDMLLSSLSRKNLSTFGRGTFELNEIFEADEHEPNNALKQVSFNVREGEIVCIAGIDGNGQTEFVYGLTGLEPVVSGKITLNGQDITKMPIRKRNIMGMSHIPEDRHKHGLVLDYSLEDNLVLERYFEPEFTDKAGFLRRDNIRKYAEKLIEQYDVRSGQGPVTIARSMSGGNQQKAIVAREIDRDPELLVAVQPTRGLDVGAIEYIHKQLVAQRDAGKAVLLVSLELDEVMDVPDRILVMYEGEIVGELDPKKTTQEELGLYMAGAKRDEVTA